MKLDIKVDPKTYKELEAAFKRAADRAAAIVDDAALAGGRVIERAADAKAPGPDVIAEVTDRGPGFAEVSIGPDKDHWYYKFFEYGASSHQIQAKGAKLLAFEGRQGTVMISQVSHPGMAARPFLRPALTQNKTRASQAAGETFKRALGH